MIMELENQVIEKAQKWLSSSVDEDFKSEIQRMLDSEDNTELVDSFYKDLEFGTGGLRGIMGVGSNRMNKYTVGMATQGLANYLKINFKGQETKAVIAHDSRNNSPFFAKVAADVLSANGIKVFLFDELRPTPELSFAIRHLKAQTGIVVTASHNPKEYNGYKAYWADGAQVVPPHDKNIIAEVSKIESVDDINFEGNSDLIQSILKEIDEPYLEAIYNNALSLETIKKQKDLKIVFSSIHGTGVTMVPPILEKLGFESVTVLESQATPDGNFPTVVYPNPEEAEAMSLAVEKAMEIDADLVMATDPDSDRVGIAVKNLKGEWQLLNGNQTAILIINYLLEKWKENGKLKGNQFVVKTIVTADLIFSLCDAYDVPCYETLTGFKYIAELIGRLEGKEEFIGGGEESYGYLIGDKVRDKDAIASCAMIAELAASAKENGSSVFETLIDIYNQHGLYKESLLSITKKGKAGADEIKQMMADLRANPPVALGGSKVVKVADYDTQEAKNMVDGTTSKIDLPKANVLQFFTEEGSKISARPSGTEPKIKFYFSVKGGAVTKETFDSGLNELDRKIEMIKGELKLV